MIRVLILSTQCVVGVIDSMFQEPSYAEYAYTHGLIPLGAKKKFDADWVECLENIERSEKPVTRGSFSSCRLMSKVLDAAGRPNEYNTATFVSYDRLYKKGSPFDTFFQDPEVQTALHVRGYNLPGINVLPEDVDWTGTEDNFFYYPPKGWQVIVNLSIQLVVVAAVVGSSSCCCVVVVLLLVVVVMVAVVMVVVVVVVVMVAVVVVEAVMMVVIVVIVVVISVCVNCNRVL